MSSMDCWEDFERDYPTAAKKFLEAYKLLTEELKAVKQALLEAVKTLKIDPGINKYLVTLRDGTCPDCQEVVCYLLGGDTIWEHSKPAVVYSSEGVLTDEEGRRFNVTYQRCSGSGKVAEDPYTPLLYDPLWELRPHSEIRMILRPKASKRLRMSINE